VDELVSNADLALYDAKAAGGRILRLFVPQLRACAEARRKLDGELRRACTQNEFELHYQPQIGASDNAVAGAEALLRWRHPERGLLAPGVFIDTLAENAVAPQLGRWILKTACRTAAGWRKNDGTGPTIAVNLFPAQFRTGTLLQDVEEALAESGLPPEALELEITENIALDHDDSVLTPLVQLRARGVGIAFDDFGTGYASLSYLTRYPLTRIKIDRSFVSNIAEQPASEDTAIVRSIIAMANNLGLEVTAEGVESAAQAAFLRSEGCHDLQGYLFSRPVPGEEFSRFLDDWQAGNERLRASATACSA
jgi:EAL domain-containing protein (putative c-di-GMP-specific phosphodiesterase class I)